MKIFEHRNDKGSLLGFEIRSLWPRWVAYRVIRSIPGVEIVQPLRHFVLENQDVFCVFKVGEATLEIEEPWGDNSRFHVSTNPPAPSAELEMVKEHFRSYRPWPFSLFNG